MPKTIDPLATAQLLEGVARSLRFLAEMPEGFIEAHLDPAAVALHIPAGKPLALPKPAGRRTTAEPPTDDPKVRAVKLRLDGMQPHKVAEVTGLSVHQVYQATTDARTAGVKFPVTPRAKAGEAKVNRPTSFHTSVDQLSERSLPMVRKAAATRGITVEALMARRKLALEMGLAGRHIRAVMEATKETKASLTMWFTTARSAGYPVPYMVDAMITQVEPAPNVVPIKRPYTRKDNRTFPTSEAELTSKGRTRIESAAADMGLTLASYFDKRAQALAMFVAGKGTAEIAGILNIGVKRADNWRRRAYQAGKIADMRARA